jgi:hypothetical protein
VAAFDASLNVVGQRTVLSLKLVDRLLIEVWDSNVQPPVPRVLENGFPQVDAESGRGLFLVETLSERWGWYPTRNPGGKVTWCELGRDGKRT